MGDLISRDKAVAAVLGASIEYQLIYGKKEPKEGFVRSIIKSLANIPQEETERKQGKWILWNEPGNECAICSACNAEFDQIDLYIGGTDYPKYCPECGAKMIKDDEQDNPAGS